MLLSEKIIKPGYSTISVNQQISQNIHRYNDLTFFDFNFQELIENLQDQPKPEKSKEQIYKSILKVIVGNQDKLIALLENQLEIDLNQGITFGNRMKKKFHRFFDKLYVEFEDEISIEDLDTYVIFIYDFINHFDGQIDICPSGLFGLCKYNLKTGTKPKVCKMCQHHKTKKNKNWVEFRNYLIENVCPFKGCPNKGKSCKKIHKKKEIPK